MTALGATLAGRRAAEKLMVDTFTIGRPDETQEPDPHTGQRPLVDVYGGPGRLTTYEPFEQQTASGGAEFTTQRYYLHLPVSAVSPAPDDVVTCTASVGDPALVGRSYRVLAGHRKTFATAQRIPVQEVL